LERLEDRTLLSVSILGNVFNDLNGNGSRQGGEPGLAGQTVFLDLNHDGKLGSVINTVNATSTKLHNFGGIFGAILTAKNLPTAVQDVTVNMDVTNNSSDPVPVVLLSPTGLSAVLGTGDIFQGPFIFTLQPGQHFVGTFDGASTNPVTQASSPVPNGTYAPQQTFTSPQDFIENVSPNGTWSLLFLPPSGSSVGLTVKSWSLSFTQPEPSTQTDGAGNFSFTNLAAGTYNVDLAVPAADVVTSPGGASQSVTVPDGQTATVNFGVQPAPDLTSVSFRVVSPPTAWGQQVTVNYTLTNQGAGDAPAFDVGLYLSSNGVISTSGPKLDTLHITGGLKAGQSISGSDTVTLPSAAPAGFGSPTTAYVGFVIDPTNSVTDVNRANNSNQGAGIDLALLGANTNVAVTTGSSIQQAPSIAVDPTNANHVVAAYMDYSLLSTGYAGIGIAVSNDGGKTWSHSSVPLPTGFDQGAADPTVAFDGQGNLFVSFLAATFKGTLPKLTDPDSSQRADGFQSDNGIFVAKSADGGKSWGTPVAVVEHVYNGTNRVSFDTEPSMSIDTFATLPDGKPNPYYGSIYVAWARFYAPGQFPGDSTSVGGSDVLFALSSDGGANFQTQVQNVAGTWAGTGVVSAIQDPFDGGQDNIAANGFVKLPTVAAGPGGAVYVSTYTGGYFTVFSSGDGGRSINTGSSKSPSWVSGFTAPSIGGLGGTYLGNPFDYTSTQVLADPTLDNFRTFSTRRIAADPTRPGYLYAVAENSLDRTAAGGSPANGIVFAVSTDYGESWTSNFTVGSEPSQLTGLTPDQINQGWLPVLNDDNNGQDPAFAASLQNQVVSHQAIPSISVSPQGVITVIWYDTRSDPANHNIQVWATESADGGQHFSANFAVTNTAFDPNAGAFTAGNGTTSYYLGDQIGVAAANGNAYAVWTDTRNGTQHIFSGSFALTPAPEPPADRFSPNFTRQTATDLGQVTVEQVVPNLNLLPGTANEWFKLEAGATGVLNLSVTASAPGGTLQAQLTDASGNVLPAVLTDIVDSTGAVVGKELANPSVSGQTYFVHVFGTNDAGINYTLTAADLTADFGTQVQETKSDTLAAGAQNVYRIAAGVTGSMVVSLASANDVVGAGLAVQVLSADGQTVLAMSPTAAAGTSQQVSIPVTQGQVVLLQVSGADASSAGDFTLQVTNLDQFETPNAKTLFFPTASDPNGLVAADFNNDGKTDLIATNTTGSDTVSVLLGNGDGTFRAEQQSAVGPGLGSALTSGDRQPAVANLNGDKFPDVIVPNFRSGDVSVLLGNGDGSFQPQRRFNAIPSPNVVVTGDFNEDGKTDAVVLQDFSQGSVSKIGVLIGRGDGTFLPPVYYSTVFTEGAGPMVVGDFSGKGHLDVIVFSKNESIAQIFHGTGKGTFISDQKKDVFATGENTFNAAAVDLNGDGKLDLVTTGTNTGNVYVMFGNGDGTFQAPHAYLAMAPRPGDNVTVNGLAVVDFGTDTHPDIIVTAASRSGRGPAEVIELPGLVDGLGHFAGIGAPVVLASVATAGEIAAGKFTTSGATDLAVADKGGITVIYGDPVTIPASTKAQPRQLGTVVHTLTQPQAIVTGHEDAWYKLTVPTEAAPGAGKEVLDFSGLFTNTQGAGLSMEVTNALGTVLGSGARFRVEAAQGEVLTLRVFGVGGTGAGAYTLDIDVLPQLVSVAAPSLLPGGSSTTMVLTFQGDRLDPAAAENPANYTVIWLGPDGKGHQVIPIGTNLPGNQAVIYNPGANVQVSSGRTYPTAVRQTVTLLFADPLPAGSYEIELSPAIQAKALNANELNLLAGAAGFTGHPVVTRVGTTVTEGVDRQVQNLVSQAGPTSSLSVFNAGTPFLTQLQNDLEAFIDAQLAKYGDVPAITTAIINQLLARFGPAVGAPGNRLATYMVLVLDPVSLDLADPQGNRVTYDLQKNIVQNNETKTYVEVGNNVELLVVANPSGAFNLNVADVPLTARGALALFTADATQTFELTDSIRGGTSFFSFEAGEAASQGVASTQTSATIANQNLALVISLLTIGLTEAESQRSKAPVAVDEGVSSGGLVARLVANLGLAANGGYDDSAAEEAAIDDFFWDWFKFLESLGSNDGTYADPVWEVVCNDVSNAVMEYNTAPPRNLVELPEPAVARPQAPQPAFFFGKPAAATAPVGGALFGPEQLPKPAQADEPSPFSPSSAEGMFWDGAPQDVRTSLATAVVLIGVSQAGWRPSPDTDQEKSAGRQVKSLPRR
jgi:hypothetical protein